MCKSFCPSCFLLYIRTPSLTGTSACSASCTLIAYFVIFGFIYIAVWLSMAMCKCYLFILLQDYTWLNIQCLEAVYGNESKTFWWMYTAVQSRAAKVSFRCSVQLIQFDIPFRIQWYIHCHRIDCILAF